MSKLTDRVSLDLGNAINTVLGDTITLIAPNGIKQTANGVILGTQHKRGSEGEMLIVNNPSAIIQLSSLSVAPSAGEKWCIVNGDTTYSMEGKPVKSEAMDRITINLKRVTQS